ncbi:hypothetical protein WN944_018478 [Citrus x changshan-huyou]|uniref:Uncharacterized protein n=1 Tax=Citrus x changshan-huyou TaxID=2935761 RepID=A0AAP0LTJ3_9ROSI
MPDGSKYILEVMFVRNDVNLQASDRFIILCLKSSDDSQITEFLFSFSFLKSFFACMN